MNDNSENIHPNLQESHKKRSADDSYNDNNTSNPNKICRVDRTTTTTTTTTELSNLNLNTNNTDASGETSNSSSNGETSVEGNTDTNGETSDSCSNGETSAEGIDNTDANGETSDIGGIFLDDDFDKLISEYTKEEVELENLKAQIKKHLDPILNEDCNIKNKALISAIKSKIRASIYELESISSINSVFEII